MSFIKRFVNIKFLVDCYRQDKENGIENLIRKSDAFIFEDDESEKIIETWIKDKNLAIQLLEKNVLRITAASSSNS